jgi:bifunctional DNA-binding transcriptional regulator/antitoxin component of YhaV-PrlF toxin-antitoxin module
MNNLVRVERNRGRVSLGRAVPGLKPGDLFEVEVEDDGTIVLIRVETVKSGKRDEP